MAINNDYSRNRKTNLKEQLLTAFKHNIWQI
jgi:hypothetical protein